MAGFTSPVGITFWIFFLSSRNSVESTESIESKVNYGKTQMSQLIIFVNELNI